jgi:serine protease Do
MNLRILLLIVITSATGRAEINPRGPLPETERTNGAATLNALNDLKAGVLRSTASLVDEKGGHLIAATWVSDDGYFLAPASAVTRPEKDKLRLPEGRSFPFKVVHRAADLDLLLGKVTDLPKTQPVNWGTSRSLNMGQWLCTSKEGGQELRIGVISALRRQIPGMGAALGIRMEEAQREDDKGVKITGIAEDSPAEAAGLEANDVILTLAGKAVGKFQQVHEIVSRRQPGEEIEVRYRRKDKIATCTVRLASRTKVLSNWEGEDFGNGGISIRTDNYPDILQHDIPLAPEDMGSPLVDLNGRAVGINISRVDRVTTFALPMETFWTSVQQWIAQDRQTPKPALVEEVKKAVRVSQ